MISAHVGVVLVRKTTTEEIGCPRMISMVEEVCKSVVTVRVIVPMLIRKQHQQELVRVNVWRHSVLITVPVET